MLEKIRDFVVNHWVSWLIEAMILGAVAFFTIHETRKTNEQTREMLARFESAISEYASEKSEAVDQAVSDGVEASKEKIQSLTVDDVTTFINKINSSD